MKFVDAQAFITSLMTLSAVLVSAPSNAQFTPELCSATPDLDYAIAIEQDRNLATPCIQDAIKTIYNPHSTWQPDL
ncbi:hypothetical protein IQ255_10480 [Pleurocapsales cyanobacterium LEGE 10410]|nr:hypothetical protein [Pleurocapsales cyanobacterium LEGE 10410]